MPLTDLDERERDVVRQCLKAAVESPFFPEWEFGTIFGLERDDVRRVLLSWPDINEVDESVIRAVNNSFNNLFGLSGEKQARIMAAIYFSERHRIGEDLRQMERTNASRFLQSA